MRPELQYFFRTFFFIGELFSQKGTFETFELNITCINLILIDYIYDLQLKIPLLRHAVALSDSEKS